jgi:hypothetical protein
MNAELFGGEVSLDIALGRATDANEPGPLLQQRSVKTILFGDLVK